MQSQQQACQILPINFSLIYLDLEFKSFTENDWVQYLSIYGDEALMQHINKTIDRNKIKKKFEAMVKTHARSTPSYRSYRIMRNHCFMGILGLKWMSEYTLQMGVILLNQYQKRAWSKRIKTAVLSYAFEQLNVSSMVAYCATDNGAANHVNQSLGMKLSGVLYDTKKATDINKWEKNNHQINEEQL